MVRSNPTLTSHITHPNPLHRVRRYARMVPRRPSPQVVRLDRLRRQCVLTLLSPNGRTWLSCGYPPHSLRHGVVDSWLRHLGTQAWAQRSLGRPSLALRSSPRAQPVCPDDLHRLLRPQLLWPHRLREVLGKEGTVERGASCGGCVADHARTCIGLDFVFLCFCFWAARPSRRAVETCTMIDWRAVRFRFGFGVLP